MGGIFSAPSPPPLPPAPQAPDPSIEEKKARLDSIERQRRGRAGTIVTSDRGLLSINDTVPKKKSLLGE